MADEKREYSQRFRAAKVRAEMISRPSSDSAPAASSAPSRLPWDLYHVQAPEPSHAPQLSPKRWPMESRNMDDSTSVASVIGALEASTAGRSAARSRSSTFTPEAAPDNRQMVRT